MLINPSGTNFNEIWLKIKVFSFKKTCLKMLSATIGHVCFGLAVLVDQTANWTWRPTICQTHSLASGLNRPDWPSRIFFIFEMKSICIIHIWQSSWNSKISWFAFPGELACVFNNKAMWPPVEEHSLKFSSHEGIIILGNISVKFVILCSVESSHYYLADR